MEYFVIFLLLVFASALLINGWFLVTRGKEEVQPDNSVRKVGKIAMGWYFFWTREKHTKKVYYEGKQLECIAEQMKHYVNQEINLYGTARLIILPGFKNKKRQVENALDVCIEIEETQEPGPIYATVYKEEVIYVYPEWLRDMMAECVTCHATPYGNLIFWTFISLCRQYALGDMGVWNEISGMALITTWLAYWVSLAYVNTWLYQRLKH
mgnify:CR=1 FL=1